MQDNTFGQTLKRLRIDNRLSQRQLGEALGVCNQTVSFWETGSREPDLDTVRKIAEYFDVSCDFLLGRSQF